MTAATEGAAEAMTAAMTNGRPRSGGTLRLHGPGDVDRLDPLAPADPAALQLGRLCTRQLFTYAAGEDPADWPAITPVPDLAEAIPSIYNAGVGASYTSYLVRLRPDACWDSTPPRPVHARDVIRGLKRMCAPPATVAELPYFLGTLRGLAEFHAGYLAAVPGPDPTAEQLAAYQDSHEIAGVFALDAVTVVIELEQPALDLIDLLALPCASPAPVEYDAVLPDSPGFRRVFRSTGPYRPVAHEPGRTLRLERNPHWNPAADPVRRQHLDAIEVRPGFDVAARIRAGAADAGWGTPAARPADGLAAALDPYLVLNTRTLDRREVRQAIAYAIDRTAIAGLLTEMNPGTTARPAGSVVPPGNEAHQDIDPFPTPGRHGDPDRARRLLAEAGHPEGVRLVLAHPDTERDAAVARSCAVDLDKAGIGTRLLALDPPRYRRMLHDPGRAEGGEWDIALASWRPAWLPGNGRAFAQPLFASSATRGTANYGRYHDAGVDALIARALESTDDPERRIAAWREVERRALMAAAVVPICFRAPTGPPSHGSRVRDARPLAAIGYALDLSTCWLD